MELSKRTRQALRVTMSVIWPLLLLTLIGCSYLGLAKKSLPVIGRPMAENVDIVGLDSGAVFIAPATGDLFADTAYKRIMAWHADGKDEEVCLIVRRDYYPLNKGDTIIVPTRSIFASARWEKIAMRFRIKP